MDKRCTDPYHVLAINAGMEGILVMYFFDIAIVC